MRASEDMLAEVEPVRVAFGGEDAPAVAVENVSRHYDAVRFGRIYRVFSVFGGVAAQVDIDDDDDSDEDDIGPDEEEEEEEEAKREAKVALAGISLHVSGSGCLAFVGPARSGKSVLLRTIAGITAPTGGRIVVRGSAAPAIASLARLLPRQGRVRRVLPSFAASLGLPVRQVRRRLPEIFELYGDPMLGKKPIGAVLGKQRSNLFLAMMLALDSDIVIIDAVFPEGRFADRCRERLTELKRTGSLVIIASPNVESVAWIADHVVYLHEGLLAGSERIDAALERSAAPPAAPPELDAEQARA